MVEESDEVEQSEVVNALDVIREPSGGDEWLATPAWIKTAGSMFPTDHVPVKTKPNSALELEWVHGYRGYDCRNNIGAWPPQ